MPEEKRKINAWIPVSLYEKIGSAGYENTTQAIITALERLLEDPREDTKGSTEDIERIHEGYRKDIEGYLQDIAGYKEDISRIQKDLEKQNQDITGYKQDIIRLKEDLDKRPDPVTFAQLQARYEGIQEIIREKDRSIERLENDLQKAGQREEDLKQLHNNYMLQMQSLINARALSAPSGSRTTKEANRKKQEETGSPQEENRKSGEESPTTKESPDTEPEVKPEVNQEEKKANTKEVTCLNCGKVFTAARATRLYCSGACKTAYGRKQKTS